GLKHFLRDEYTDARAEFQLAQKGDSNPIAADWIRRTDYEINRLNPVPIPVDSPGTRFPSQSAPVVLTNAPATTWGRTVQLVGKVQVNEGHRIDRVEFTLNGAPLLDSSGVRRRVIGPRTPEESRELAFKTPIPLRRGPNAIVVTAYGDSTLHS